MNRLKIETFTQDAFMIRVVDGSEGTVVVKFSGTLEHPSPGEFLDPILLTVHERAVACRLDHVDADFSGLDFLNSSGIKSLIKWVMKAVEASRPGQDCYRLRLLYSSKVTWQQASLKAITFLTKGQVVAEPLPAGP